MPCRGWADRGKTLFALPACGAGSVSRSGVRPPVCLSRYSTAAAACGWFAAERRAAGDIDLQRRAPYVQFSPDVLCMFSMAAGRFPLAA